MEYLIIGVLAAAFGVSVTVFAHKLKSWRKEENDEEE